jgi:DNA-3-methyladenine glycosylase II
MTAGEIKGRRLAKALAHLGAVDPDMRRAIAEIGPPPSRRSEPGFGGLMRIVLGQQLSVHAARAIWDRLSAAVGSESLAPGRMLAFSDEELGHIGFSRQKMRFARALADAVNAKHFDFAALERMADDAALDHLTAIHGIGQWTAEVYMLFALGRPDVMPAGDLALLVAAGKLKRKRRRPTPPQLRRMAEPWRPWRSVAARMLWHYYRNAPL